METKEIILSNGIIIKDSRSLGCGILIENQNSKYISLNYSSELGIFLNIKSVWLTFEHCFEFQKEFDEMSIILKEANLKIK